MNERTERFLHVLTASGLFVYTLTSIVSCTDRMCERDARVAESQAAKRAATIVQEATNAAVWLIDGKIEEHVRKHHPGSSIWIHPWPPSGIRGTPGALEIHPGDTDVEGPK